MKGSQPDAFGSNQKFVHKKSLGQNFLNSDYAPKKMCDAAAVVAGDTVVEIGPGTGILTKELLARGAVVHAIEADARAVAVLEDTFAAAIASKQLHLYHQDARTLDIDSFGLTNHGFKVVANIPYYLSGLLLRTFLDATMQPTTLVFLIQKELAERIARSEKESLLSLSVKVFGNPKYVTTVKRSHFTPPPQVDSAIILVENINRAHFTEFSNEHFFNVLHLGFGQKRKQLQHNLSLQYEKDTVRAALATIGVPSDVRAEDVPLSAWLELAKIVYTQ